jgi:predicted glycosyltransferase involved in capsule biosynthesis
MTDLTNSTFIIPIRIDSPDREFNFLYVLDFLTKNFQTNIIIKESDYSQKAKVLLDTVDQRLCKINYLFEQTDDNCFHRTRLLNEMLQLVKTPVTVNYDIDVLLQPDQYIKAQYAVLNEGIDLIYPFTKGDSQRQSIIPNAMKQQWRQWRAGFPLDVFNEQFLAPWNSLCGHCQFFKTQSYRSGYMENEEFMSYGAEDVERMNRFKKLGYSVMWLDGLVYHIEHMRGPNSSPSNPYFKANEKLYYWLQSLNKQQTIDYYSNVPYLKKYV